MSGNAVSIEDKKRWLYRAWNMRREVEALEEAKASSFDNVSSITPKYSGQPGGGADPHKFESYAIISSCADEKRKALEKAKAETLRAIQTIRSSEEKAIMIQRYVNMRSWSDVAASVHYSERKTFYLHGEALRHIRISQRKIEKMRAEKVCSDLQSNM